MEKRENETLTVQDIKQILNISINAAYNLIHSKSFPLIRIGNSSDSVGENGWIVTH